MKPEFVETSNNKYKINTSFKVALECEKIANDENIGDYERMLAIIYLLFGDKALDNSDEHNELLELAIKYLKCEEIDNTNSQDTNMDFEEDYDYIEASFMSDFKIDLEKSDMHWYKFITLLNGLTEDCVLNRIRYVRDYDVSQIKDLKEKEKWLKQKDKVALKKKKKPVDLSEKQKNSIDNFKRLTGLDRM